MPDKRICIDIFEKDKGSYKGWKSGYTVLSILLQLQMFFFDVEESFLTIENKKEIQENLNLMAEFKCPQCKHRGSSNPYPDFPKVNEQNTKMTQEQYQECKKKEICCYHRKTNFEEGPLGLGISISKIPDTADGYDGRIRNDRIHRIDRQFAKPQPGKSPDVLHNRRSYIYNNHGCDASADPAKKEIIKQQS